MKKNFKGYSFKPSIEQLKELKSLSAEEKLEFLEEANEFVSKFLKIEDIERFKKLAFLKT